MPETGEAIKREDLDTARLVARAQAGDREAFAGVYTRYFDRVYAYMRVALKDDHAAEDLAQQVFTNALEALPRYESRPGVPFRRWLFVLARHEALAELQKRGRIEPTDPNQLDLDRQAAEPGEEDIRALDWISDPDLLSFIERLPLPQREVVFLRYMLDLGYPEIAKLLGRGLADVRSLHSRGVRFLRERLKGLGRTAANSDRIRMRAPTKQPPVTSARRWAL